MLRHYWSYLNSCATVDVQGSRRVKSYAVVTITRAEGFISLDET